MNFADSGSPLDRSCVSAHSWWQIPCLVRGHFSKLSRWSAPFARSATKRSGFMDSFAMGQDSSPGKSNPNRIAKQHQLLTKGCCFPLGANLSHPQIYYHQVARYSAPMAEGYTSATRRSKVAIPVLAPQRLNNLAQCRLPMTTMQIVFETERSVCVGQLEEDPIPQAPKKCAHQWGNDVNRQPPKAVHLKRHTSPSRQGRKQPGSQIPCRVEARHRQRSQ